MRILIADDEFACREVLETSLAKWGHEVIVRLNGAEAWEVLQREDAPKLAILDWNMPKMEGIEVCQKVREMPQTHPIYILLVTSRSGREDIVTGLDAGADDYLIKPVDRGELRARLQVGQRIVELQEKLLKAERVRVLAETAGAAAHHINQPLTVLIGKADLLLGKMASDDPYRNDIETFQKAGQQINEIVRQMKAARQYVTTSYIGRFDIVDFDAASQEEGEGEGGEIKREYRT